MTLAKTLALTLIPLAIACTPPRVVVQTVEVKVPVPVYPIDPGLPPRPEMQSAKLTAASTRNEVLKAILQDYSALALYAKQLEAIHKAIFEKRD